MQSDLVILPLRAAVFCVDCEVMSNATGRYCPVCGSPSLFAVANVLDRSAQQKIEKVLEYASA